MNFHGIPIVENLLAMSTVPVREHKARFPFAGIHPTGYHARIQKKWTKRYGTKQVPAFFIVNNGQMIVTHPALLADIRKVLSP